MRLRTFGTLGLEGSDFRRAKPLLLLAFLAAEGAKPRRYLAELLWPGASSAMNSLSVALSQLRRGAPGVIEADEERAYATVACDLEEFQQALRSHDLETALSLYQGAFLEDISLELGIELEEWLYGKQEQLAAQLRAALIARAEQAAVQGRFDDAAADAASAYRLPGGGLEPEQLLHVHAMLIAAQHPLARELRQEAESFGMQVQISSQQARNSLQPSFIGRDDERHRLESLAMGSWAWLRGAGAMGKTSLLKSLSGQYLPGRSGLPYATLEPLLQDVLEEGEVRMLRQLMHLEQVWLIDDWEKMDSESRALLERLHGLHPGAKIIIASAEPPPFVVDLSLELGALSPEELAGQPQLWERTGGLPTLVGALLRNEPLEAALERRLAALPAPSSDIYLALALLETPDLAKVRRALQLSAGEMASRLEALLAAGLVTPSGQVSARAAALDFLQAHPARSAPLALQLARELEPLTAFPLYQQSRTLWEASDLEAVQTSYLAWSQEVLRRGFPQRVQEILADLPNRGAKAQAVQLLRARALERTGQYRDALEHIGNLPETPEVLALQAALLWRLGQPEAAQAAAEQALAGDLPVRAEAMNTLGHMCVAQGEYREAAKRFRRAGTLWLALGETVRYVETLNSLAVSMSLLGDDASETFQQALQASGDNPQLQARVLLNIGWMHERFEHYPQAETSYLQASQLAEEAGALATATMAWNNLGALHHKQGQLDKAARMYEKALAIAQRLGERYRLGMILANLAELNEDQEAWEEALALLEASGHEAEADQYRADLPQDHPFRLRSEG